MVLDSRTHLYHSPETGRKINSWKSLLGITQHLWTSFILSSQGKFVNLLNRVLTWTQVLPFIPRLAFPPPCSEAITAYAKSQTLQQNLVRAITTDTGLPSGMPPLPQNTTYWNNTSHLGAAMHQQVVCKHLLHQKALLGEREMQGGRRAQKHGNKEKNLKYFSCWSSTRG